MLNIFYILLLYYQDLHIRLFHNVLLLHSNFYFLYYAMFKFEWINIFFSNSLFFNLVNNFFFFKSFTIITAFVYLFIAFGNWFDFKYSSPSFFRFLDKYIFVFIYSSFNLSSDSSLFDSVIIVSFSLDYILFSSIIIL